MTKRKESISSILLGDSLAEVVSKLPAYIENGNTKIIVIFTSGDNIDISCSANTTKFESVGILYKAISEFE